MFEFFLIKDNQQKPEHPEAVRLKSAGNLSYQAYENLHEKGLIINYKKPWSDFRWRSTDIEKLYNKLKKLKADSNGIELLNLLHKARNHKTGLIAYPSHHIL